jgi:8-oxo-dGTP diphosphatase
MTVVGVGVVVRRPDGRVLVGRRLAEPHQPIAIPGGKLDPGETVEECGVRELQEETGIAVDTVTPFAAVLVDGWVVVGVEARVGGDTQPTTREPDKFGAFAWIEPAAVSVDAAAFPATRELLTRLTT